MKAVIFDMDGVIFDSERAISDLWIEYAKQINLENIEKAVYLCIGITDAATRQVFVDMYGEDFPYEEHKAVISKLFHEKYDGGRLPVKPGIGELLKYLWENNIPLALASSSKTINVRNQLQDAGFLQYFSVVIGGDTIKNSKPDPEIFLTAASKLGVEPADCFVIEDSYNGIRAAHNAGMHPLMVPDMLQPDGEIRELAEQVYPSLIDVLEDFKAKKPFN